MKQPEPMNHQQFFKLSNITVTDDDVSALGEEGFDMETIFFIVNNGSEDDLDEIIKSIPTKVPKALSIRFRNMCLIIRDYMRNFSTNGVILILLPWLMSWNGIIWIST